jgi:hypothetical protein
VQRTFAHLVRECDGDGPLTGCPIIEALLGETSVPLRHHRAPIERKARPRPQRTTFSVL